MTDKGVNKTRRDQRDNDGTPVGYQTDSGRELAWAGDDDAPRVNANNKIARRFHHPAAVEEIEVVAGRGRLLQYRCTLAAAVVLDRFAQVHDASEALAAGAEPLWEMLVPGSLTTPTTFAEAGDGFDVFRVIEFEEGLRLAISTTPGVFTSPGGNEGFFQATFVDC